MSEYHNNVFAIAYMAFLAVVLVIGVYSVRRAKTSKYKAYQAVASLNSELDALANRAAAPGHENDQQLAALIFLVKDNLRWARMALIVGKYLWAEKIVVTVFAEIAKRR